MSLGPLHVLLGEVSKVLTSEVHNVRIYLNVARSCVVFGVSCITGTRGFKFLHCPCFLSPLLTLGLTFVLVPRESLSLSVAHL